MTKRTRAPLFNYPRQTGERVAHSASERFLGAIGIDAGLIDAVVGDLEEEFTDRAERDGVRSARWWYVSEVVRSAPHVIVSALRQRDSRARLRLLACLATLLLPFVLTVAFVVLRDGPPARLVADVATSEGIVLNTMKPVQLQMRVFDRRGHVLESNGVRYRWISGAPMVISPEGVVACAERGNAVVAATLGDITTNVDLRCRPVKELQASTWVDFMVGDAPRDLPFVAIGTDGYPVLELRGEARIVDSSIATLVGTTVRPRAVGQTPVIVDVGDRKAMVRVTVHERVGSFVGLRADQRYVAVSVRLSQGDTVRWALPRGAYWIKYLPKHEGDAPPTIALNGPASCSPGDGLHVYRTPREEYAVHCLVHGAGGTVDLKHGRVGAAIVEGSLMLERIDFR